MICYDGISTGRPKKGSYREGRNRKLCIRISDRDLNRLKYLCDIYGVTMSDFIASCIDNEITQIIRKEMESG